MQLKPQNNIIITVTIIFVYQTINVFSCQISSIGEFKRNVREHFHVLQEEVWKTFWPYIKSSEVNVASDTTIPFLGI